MSSSGAYGDILDDLMEEIQQHGLPTPYSSMQIHAWKQSGSRSGTRREYSSPPWRRRWRLVYRLEELVEMRESSELSGVSDQLP